MDRKELKTNNLFSWIIHFLKGMIIGAGAILPGVSGGALAAIFGLYEPIINFLANVRNNFLKNILYFLPVGLGALFGVLVLATPIHYGLKYYPVHILWGFIGAIFGTFPSLYQEAGKKGRKEKHIILVAITTVITFSLLTYANKNLNMYVSQDLFSWLMAGGIFASGLVVPGLSPSNFLIYFNLYQPLIAGIKTFDWSIIIPVAIGAVIAIFMLAKFMRKVLSVAYATVFHLILGVVIASTVIIAPESSLYQDFQIFDYSIVFFIFSFSCGLGYWMGQIEERYK